MERPRAIERAIIFQSFGKVFFGRLLVESVGRNSRQHPRCHISSIARTFHHALHANAKDRVQTNICVFVSREDYRIGNRSTSIWFILDDNPHHVLGNQSDCNGSGSDLMFLSLHGGLDNVSEIQASKARAYGRFLCRAHIWSQRCLLQTSYWTNSHRGGLEPCEGGIQYWNAYEILQDLQRHAGRSRSAPSALSLTCHPTSGSVFDPASYLAIL